MENWENNNRSNQIINKEQNSAGSKRDKENNNSGKVNQEKIQNTGVGPGEEPSVAPGADVDAASG